MLSLLKPLFADKLLIDDREPCLTFDFQDGTYGLMLPKLEFWKQLVYLLVLNTIIMMSVAVVIYKCIIERRGTTFSYLVGYGLVIPFVLLHPYYILEELELENIVLKMGSGIPPTVLFFRATAAMHNTSLPLTEASLENYVYYCSSVVNFCWDPKTKRRAKITTPQLLTNLWRIITQGTMLGLLVSLGLAHDFKPFESNVVLNDYHLTSDLFRWGHLANNYILAWTTFFTLSFGFNMVGLGHNLQGFKTPDIFQNPMLLAKSPSDFWSKRWNDLMQTDLKHGVFRPLKKVIPTKLALVITFLSSGLLHDYNWTIMFYHAHSKRIVDDADLFFPIAWKQSCFFLWNGIVVLLEPPLGKLQPFRWAAANLPTPVIATLLSFTVLPVVHWFTGDWVVGGMYASYTVGLLRVVQL